MIQHIREWIAFRNELRRLESMNDRLLEDIGVDRADLRPWLAGAHPAPARSTRPLTTRVRAATIAFVRELRTVEPSHSH